MVINIGQISASRGPSARLSYLEGDSKPLADFIRSDDPITPDMRRFVASIVDGTVEKKRRGRKPDPEFIKIKREILIPESYRLYKMLAEISITLERFDAAVKAGLIPRDATLPLLNDEGNPIRVPTPKGWKNTGGSVKDRALRSVGREYGLSPERISEIVYPRKRGKP